MTAGRFRFLTLAICTFLFANLSYAAVVVFGPKTYSVAVDHELDTQETIALTSPCDPSSAVYTLVLINGNANGTGRLRNGSIKFNGTEVISQDTLRNATAPVRVTVTRQPASTLGVKLRPIAPAPSPFRWSGMGP